MMFAERWLNRAPPATSATSATQREKVNNSAGLEVATALLPGYNLKRPKAPGSKNAAPGSKGAATRIPPEISRFPNQVAEVAEVADLRSRQPEHDKQQASWSGYFHQSMVVAPVTRHHSFADLLDRFEDGSALAEHDGGLSRSDAERQALAETARLVPGLDDEVIDQVDTWLEALCPAEWAFGVLWIKSMPTPRAFPEWRWIQFQIDAVAFARSWGQASHRCRLDGGGAVRIKLPDALVQLERLWRDPRVERSHHHRDFARRCGAVSIIWVIKRQRRP